jgi:uncharacterized protein YjbI with pentapeptide repeats
MAKQLINGVEREIAPFAHLAGAHLTRANLAGANLTGAYLTGANLAGADLGTGPKVQGLGGRATRSDGYEFLIFQMQEGEPVIRAGCRTFTPTQFRAHTETYGNDAKRAETLRVLDFLETQLAGERWY